MKTHYKVIYSAIIKDPIDHLPITCKTKFRTLDTACVFANKLVLENRNVSIFEVNEYGNIVASWGIGANPLVFDENKIAVSEVK